MKLDHPRPGQAPLLQALWQEAFGDDLQWIRLFWKTAYAPHRCLCITEKRQVTAAAYWLDCHYAGGKLAYVYAVATAKSHRGRGLCHSLMRGLQRNLQQTGYAGIVLVPGEPSLGDFYRGMGYKFFGGMTEIAFKASEAPAQLQTLSPLVYNRRRQTLLPSGGVAQMGENLRYLAAQADFYGGEDFLLACRREGNILFGLELLGNTQQAPHILCALGLPEGRFRIPGRGNFAMYLPLQDAPAPTYFGFAFD